jgi:hypothetical protein
MVLVDVLQLRGIKARAALSDGKQIELLEELLHGQDGGAIRGIRTRRWFLGNRVRIMPDAPPCQSQPVEDSGGFPAASL